MARLKLIISDELMMKAPACADRLWPGEGMRVAKAIAHLIKSGDLCLQLSDRLEWKLKAFAAKQKGESSQGIEEVDEVLFLSWLRQEVSMEPALQWQVESLPDNGGIYRILLEGGRNEKGIHNHSG